MLRVILNYSEGYGWRPSVERYDHDSDSWARYYKGEHWPDIQDAAAIAKAQIDGLTPPPPPGPLLLED